MLNINSRLKLRNGLAMPRLGLGVWRVNDGETGQVVGWALEAGYRLIDTASYYRNESAVGLALKDSGLPREDLFITSKVWNDSQGYEKTLISCQSSLKRLSLEYLDLYLLHWPVDGPELTVDSWLAMEKLYDEGLVKSIGVSNFSVKQLEKLCERAKIPPMLNQVELHPLMTQETLRHWSESRGVIVEAYAPLARGRCFDDPVITSLAQKYAKSPAQIILRWQLQNGIVAIPKSLHRNRIKENAGLYDFNLTENDFSTISALNQDKSVLSTVFPTNSEGYVLPPSDK